MTTKAGAVIGLPVYTISDGKEVRKVEDVIYNPHENKVVAFLLEAGGLFSEAKVIFIKDIKGIGKDAVLIDNEDVIQPSSQIPKEVSHIVKSDTYLTSNKIITEKGEDLGKISDIVFDTKTGEVQEFEVSQGIRDLQSGRKAIQIADIVTIGKQATIVKGYTKKSLEAQAQSQGLQGAVNQAKGALGQAKDTVADRTPQVLDKIKDQANQLYEDTQSRVKNIRNDPNAQETLNAIIQKIKEFAMSIQNQSNDLKAQARQKLDELERVVSQKSAELSATTNQKTDEVKKELQPKIDDLQKQTKDKTQEVKKTIQEKAQELEAKTTSGKQEAPEIDIHSNAVTIEELPEDQKKNK